MSNIPFNIDYYILGGDGELLDARSAQIFAVDSETSFEDVEDLIGYHYDDVVTVDVMPTLSGSSRSLPRSRWMWATCWRAPT